MDLAMPVPVITFDTFNFVKKLEAVGVEPKVAEVFVNLQTELQAQTLERQSEINQQWINKFEEYRPILEEIKVVKSQLATKSDIEKLDCKIDYVRLELKADIKSLHNELKADIENLRNELKADMNGLRNELIIKLGGITVGAVTISSIIMAVLH